MEGEWRVCEGQTSVSVSGGFVLGKEGAEHQAFTRTTGNRKLRRTATKRAQKQKSAYL